MTACVARPALSRDQLYDWLDRHTPPVVSVNRKWLTQILTSWCLGEGVLPDFIGLDKASFRALEARFYPDLRLMGRAASGRVADFSRLLEREDLLRLLMSHAAPGALEERRWLAEILVTACLGEDHLWQDLGLWSRAELSGLIAHNFPTLFEKNQRDMKWKKFLYKQLCEAEGIYICRAPSCEICHDYPQCFGPEI